MLQGFRQLTGINFIVYYGTFFSKSAGVGNTFIITLTIPMVGTAIVLVGIQPIDPVGCRCLLLIGSIGTCICEFIIAIISVTSGKTNDLTHINITVLRVLIAFVCFHIAFLRVLSLGSLWERFSLFPFVPRACRCPPLQIGCVTLLSGTCLVDPSTIGLASVKTPHLAVKVFFIWCVPDIHMYVGLNKLVSLLLIPGLPHVSPALSSPTSSSLKQKALPSNKLISSTANQAL